MATNTLGITKENNNFDSYLLQYKDKAIKELKNGYFPADTVIDAYKEGVSKGKEEGVKDFKKNFKERMIATFTEKAQYIYDIGKRITDKWAKDNNIGVKSIHLNLFADTSKILIVLGQEDLLNDKIIETVYNDVAVVEKEFRDKFKELLDIILMSDENVDYTSIKEDGFDYSESLS